jgi:hypothetical protein
MTTIEGTTSTGKKRSVLLYRYQLMDCVHLEIISDQRSYAEVNLSDEKAEKLHRDLGVLLGRRCQPDLSVTFELDDRVRVIGTGQTGSITDIDPAEGMYRVDFFEVPDTADEDLDSDWFEWFPSPELQLLQDGER